MHFKDLPLGATVQKNLAALGYETPTPIQLEAIPFVAAGRDIVAIAQTGTGKTAAFALPLLEKLAIPSTLFSNKAVRPIRCLVLEPTRELASQVEDSFLDYGKGMGVRSTVIFGGVGHEPQRQVLRRGVDVVIATPGRLLDLMGERSIDLSHIEFLVLDEADRMLDMGFIHDVKRIIKALPATTRQTLLFSATMPEDIRDLAKNILKNPAQVAVTPPATTVELINQSVTFIDQSQKRALLLHLLNSPDVSRALVFTRTKHGANKMAQTLEKAGVSAMAIHGNKSQGARERALEGFKAGNLRVLVATDIAARGIDVDGVTHVVQVDLPEVPEQYVHRIGRTARAGKSGIAWAFCARDERDLLTAIERTIKKKITVQAAPSSLPTPPPEEARPPLPPRGRGRPGGHGGGRGGPQRSNAPARSPSMSTGPSSSSSSPSAGRTQSFRPGRR
jgi:ATP-dependent RNA helicase RhlE